MRQSDWPNATQLGRGKAGLSPPSLIPYRASAASSCWVWSLEKNCIWGEGRWRERRQQWHPAPVPLPGKSHGRRSLVGCSPWGREESDMTERLHFHFSLLCMGDGNGNPLQCSCLENPRDGVAQSWTRLKWLSSSSSWWREKNWLLTLHLGLCWILYWISLFHEHLLSLQSLVLSHFTDEEIISEKVTCPRSRSWWWVDLNLGPGCLDHTV